MKKFWLVFSVVTLVIVALGFTLSYAKDSNNLDQYDDQMVADILSAIDDKLYPVLKLFRSDWVKIDQGGQSITSDQRLMSVYNNASTLYQILEVLYANLANNSSCGEENAVTLHSWQVRNFGGIAGYCYFLPEKAKLKIERVALQSDDTGWVKNITCARDVAGLDGFSLGQEQSLLEILSYYFPGFTWGNVVWNPDDSVSFGVEVIGLPAEYLLPATK